MTAVSIANHLAWLELFDDHEFQLPEMGSEHRQRRIEMKMIGEEFLRFRPHRLTVEEWCAGPLEHSTSADVDYNPALDSEASSRDSGEDDLGGEDGHCETAQSAPSQDDGQIKCKDNCSRYFKSSQIAELALQAASMKQGERKAKIQGMPLGCTSAERTCRGAS